MIFSFIFSKRVGSTAGLDGRWRRKRNAIDCRYEIASGAADFRCARRDGSSWQWRAAAVAVAESVDFWRWRLRFGFHTRIGSIAGHLVCGQRDDVSFENRAARCADVRVSTTADVTLKNCIIYMSVYFIHRTKNRERNLCPYRRVCIFQRIICRPAPPHYLLYDIVCYAYTRCMLLLVILFYYCGRQSTSFLSAATKSFAITNEPCLYLVCAWICT